MRFLVLALLFSASALAQCVNYFTTLPTSCVGSSGGVPTTVIYTSQLAGIHADGSATTNVGTDDRATLQTVLNTATAATPLELVVDKGFIVIDSTSASLVWNSYTKIRCNPGAGFSWKGSNNLHQQSMIVNAHPLGIATPQDTTMRMEGCYINGNHGTGHGGGSTSWPHAANSDGIFISPIQIVGVTNLVITNHKSYQSYGFGIWIANATNFLLDNIRIEHQTGVFTVDGIHVNGPASEFAIKNVSGFAGDDLIAINADDGHLANAASGTAGVFGNNALASTIKNGPISGCYIEGVHAESSYDLFRLLSAQSALSCTLRHLDGTTTALHYIIDNDPLDFAGQPGWLGNFGEVIIDDDADTFALAGCAAQLDAIYLSLEINFFNQSAPLHPVLCTSARTQIQDFRLNLKVNNNTLGSAEILNVNGGSINVLSISGAVAYASSVQATHPIVNVTAGQITTLRFLNVEADYINNMAIVNNSLVHSVQFVGGHHLYAGGTPSLSVGSGGFVINLGTSGFLTNLLQGGAGPAPVFLAGVNGDVTPDPTPIYKGAISFYRMTEGNTARSDTSGFGRTASLTGSVPNAACANGQSGNCASFTNNAANYLTQVGWPYTISPTTGFTATGWVKFTTLSSAIQVIWAKLNEVNLIYNNTVGSGQIGVCVIGTCVYTGSTAVINTWYFVRAGWDPATSLPFISLNNGADVNGGSITPALNNGNVFTFGQQNGSLPLQGLLGPWGFWARKLTAGETTTLYNSGTFYDPTTAAPAGTPGPIAGARTTFGNNTASSGPAGFNTTQDALAYQTAEIPSQVEVCSAGGTGCASGAFTTSGSGTALEAITGLSWTFPANTALNIPFECHLVYHQNTATANVNFGFQDATIAPTNLAVHGTFQTTTAAPVPANLVGSSTTTATNIFTAASPSAITTNWNVDFWGYIEQPSNGSSSLFTIRVSTATQADTVTVVRGSYCHVGI